MPQALPNIHGDVFTLDEGTLRTGCTEAAASPRRRIILPLHRTQDALVQRMLNFLQPRTYLQPHLHPLPHASETIHIIRGALGFIIFNEDGTVKALHELRSNGLGFIDIEPQVWHGFIVLEPDTVIIEVKRGPYDPAHDKVFAPWAPAENSAGTSTALDEWHRLFP